MGKKVDYNYPLIIYNELITKAKNKSTVDYQYLNLLTRNKYSREELDLILESHFLTDIANDRPELWVLVSENDKDLPSNEYFNCLISNGIMMEGEDKELIYSVQLKKAHDYWPRRKRTGRRKK